MILDDQLSVSSSTRGHPKTESRLNGDKAWKPEDKGSNEDTWPWIQVSFEQLTNVAGIATQGQGDGMMNEWVTEYRVQTSVDGNDWDMIENSDGNEVSTNGSLDITLFG